MCYTVQVPRVEPLINQALCRPAPPIAAEWPLFHRRCLLLHVNKRTAADVPSATWASEHVCSSWQKGTGIKMKRQRGLGLEWERRGRGRGDRGPLRHRKVAEGAYLYSWEQPWSGQVSAMYH